MPHYQIKKWEEFQHYRSRRPPWIKLYRDMLTSDTWVMGSDSDRVLAIAMLILASITENMIPADPTYIQRVGCLHKPPNFDHLLSTGFIELIDASKLLACSENIHTSMLGLEDDLNLKRREEKEKKTDPLKILLSEGVSEQTAHDFLVHRRAKGAPVTPTVIKTFKAEAEKAKITLETALQECCARGWQGFKAAWHDRDKDKTKAEWNPRG